MNEYSRAKVQLKILHTYLNINQGNQVASLIPFLLLCACRQTVFTVSWNFRFFSRAPVRSPVAISTV